MATITTDTYLDGGTARTAGEAWTMNGGVLMIRTDTRWHANAPAGMLGSIGATTTSVSLGGGVLLDARNVRWMPYNTGAGVVPAIGTTVTQGGVSGYLLGVWASLTSAPTAVGATAAEVWAFGSRTLTSGAAPSAATVAAAVRTELTTELGRIDVATSTRLPTAGYTAPDNAGIAAILDDTGTSGVVLANNSITSSVVANNALNNSSFTTGYFNAINAEVDTALADDSNIAAIKAKTDSLTFTVSGQVDSNIHYVNDVGVKGVGSDADPWNPV